MSPPIKALAADHPEFAPTPDQQHLLFDQLLDPSQSLRSIAAHFQTSAEAIAIFLSRPEIAEQFASLENLVARRARLAAGAQLSAVIASAQRVLASFESGDASCSRETALRASRILIRLANFAPGPVSPRESASRAPRVSAHRADVSARPDARPRDESIGSNQSPRETTPTEEFDPQFAAPESDDLASGDFSSDEPQPESLGESKHDALTGNPDDPAVCPLDDAEQVRAALEALKSEYNPAELDELFRLAAEIVAEAQEREEGGSFETESDAQDPSARETPKAAPRHAIPRASAPP